MKVSHSLLFAATGAFGLMLFFASCSSGSSTTPTGADPDPPLADSRLAAALVMLDDRVWNTESDADGSSEGGAGCRLFDEVIAGWIHLWSDRGDEWGSAGTRFSSGPLGPFLTHRVAQRPSSSDARSLVVEVADEVGECETPQLVGGDGTARTARVTRVSDLPDVGDEMAAFRLQTENGPAQVTLLSVFVQRGSYVSALDWIGFGDVSTAFIGDVLLTLDTRLSILIAEGFPAFTPTMRTIVNGRVHGDPEAPVRIIEFSDFQCPFCQRFTLETAPLILQEFIETGFASLEYRHFAFLGPESFLAAEAAECANDQGQFWNFHDVLFLRQGPENRGVFSAGNLKNLAREVQSVTDEFDVDAFDRCMDSGRMRSVVESMTDEADALGIRSTPSFLINGKLIAGAQGIDAFRTAIELAEANR